MIKDVEDFLSHIGVERAHSTHTVGAYRKDLEQFLQFCHLIKFKPNKMKLRELRLFVGSLRKRELSNRSIARKVSTLKQYFQFLLREGKIEEDPSELLSVALKPSSLPDTLTVNEMGKLIAAASGVREVEIRDRALLELWYATGARISEIVHLKISDLDWKSRSVTILGKRRRQRKIPVHSGAIEWCQKYRRLRHEWIRRSHLAETTVFFLTQNGRAFTRQGMWKLVKKYARKAGIERNIWPHMIRHSFATHVLLGGADLRSVQELLGHRSISTTEVYTHLDTENLKLMQRKYHPRG